MQTLKKVPPTRNQPIQKTPRILVAEDNQVNQTLLKMLFKKLDLPIDIVSNGEEAVEAARKNGYDLILMDIQMPIMDGVEACREIKSLLGDKAPAIVALTANALEGDRERFLSAGLDDYLAKPLKLDDVKKAVKEFTFCEDLS